MDLYDKIKHYQLMAPLRLKGPWITFFQDVLRESGLPRDQISKLFDISEAALYACECGGQIHMSKEQFAEYQRLSYHDDDREARIERMKIRRNLPEAKAYQNEQKRLYLKQYKEEHVAELKIKRKEYYSRPDKHDDHVIKMREYMRAKKARLLEEQASKDGANGVADEGYGTEE